jgi:hypothetical protein
VVTGSKHQFHGISFADIRLWCASHTEPGHYPGVS